MKMYDLGETYNSVPMPARTKKKPEPYYPSISIKGAKGLEAYPVGKKLKIVGEGVITRHSEEKNRDGVNIHTSIDIHRIGCQPQGKGDRSQVCPGCGKGGGPGYCSACGGKRMPKTKR